MPRRVVKNNCQRVNISIPLAVLESLDKQCETMSLSRSAYITMAVNQKLQLDYMIANLPQMMDLNRQSLNVLEKYPQLALDLNGTDSE